jgi:hypothetical protein
MMTWHNPNQCDESCCQPCLLPTIQSVFLVRGTSYYDENWTLYWSTQDSEITFLYVNEELVLTEPGGGLGSTDSYSYSSGGYDAVIRIVAANSCGPVVFECTYYRPPLLQGPCNPLVAAAGEIIEKADEEYTTPPVVKVTITGLCGSMSVYNGTYYVPCSATLTGSTWSEDLQTFVDDAYTESEGERPYITITIYAYYASTLFDFSVVSTHTGGVGLSDTLTALSRMDGGFTNLGQYAVVRTSSCANCELELLEDRKTNPTSTIPDCIKRRVMPTDWVQVPFSSAPSGLAGMCTAADAVITTELIYP